MIRNGREAEYKYLENYYEKTGSQLLILYGHKDLGKTTLLLEFSKSKPHYYYLARNCSEREQQFQWGQELREGDAGQDVYPTFESIFEEIMGQKEGKKILIVDEFQYLVKNSTQFMKELIKLLHHNENMGDVFILLCSSTIGWVENSMLPRLGRAAYEISGFLKIKDCRFDSLRSYFEEYTLAQSVETYGILGGSPGLWNYFDKSLSTKDNVCRCLLNKDSILVEKALDYVCRELRETSVYDTILAAIASGKYKLNQLYTHTGFSRAKISVYLKNLMQLEIVEKVFSFDTPGRENTQKGIYRICNHLVFFYFRYLYPNLSVQAHMDKEVFYDTYIRPTFRGYISSAYRDVCAQHLETLNQKKELPIVYEKCGEWVGKAGNIDMLAQDNENRLLIAMCNWEKPGMSYADYEWLMFLQNKARIEADFLYLFSENGFDAAIKEEAGRNRAIRLVELSSYKK